MKRRDFLKKSGILGIFATVVSACGLKKPKKLAVEPGDRMTAADISNKALEMIHEEENGVYIVYFGPYPAAGVIEFSTPPPKYSKIRIIREVDIWKRQ
ncbi:hypothetical protein KAR91_23750 [Candidatus Pacearchaeota archaeon]|nr:hypothetical protein [Candidatus Pacearchaeota archaeon]